MSNALLTSAYLAWGALGLLVSCLGNWKDWSRHEDTVSASFLLLLFCGLSILSVEMLGKPDGFRLFPFMDLCGGLYILSICVRRFHWWKLILVMTFLLQGVFHASYHWGFPTHLGDNAYLARVNPVYLLQVLVAAWLGGVHVAQMVFPGLRDRPVRRHHLGHGARR